MERPPHQAIGRVVAIGLGIGLAVGGFTLIGMDAPQFAKPYKPFTPKPPPPPRNEARSILQIQRLREQRLAAEDAAREHDQAMASISLRQFGDPLPEETDALDGHDRPFRVLIEEDSIDGESIERAMTVRE